MASTSIDVHGQIARARVVQTLGSPLTIETGLQRYAAGSVAVTFFCGDADLSADLADAINVVIARHAAKSALAEAREAA